ncbi:imidazoleglycerol-phosphate dehydratase HisB [Rhodohalobacter sp. SW132]|uniref:imidazoleglycerol-phosphate dehydratase HisB n=1 Tax=Rhodohalobacter sp. SW132 TaxID=2293433 RepID=UPI000E2463F1|nr:imidazoleglycerol-phosphate dehydratase HisB [Rhodohalobacter sp. SW132]REL32863.1 imidazoleglycerol-phosphate dehydratase HisB [Rhodohalobacter sp. SW132]
MKIYIHPTALKSESESLLPEGALFGMKYLMEAEYQLGFDAGSLSDHQQKLIENESITNSGFGEADADGTIKNVDQYIFESDGKPVETADSWTEITRSILFPSRKAEISRDTKETQISISINLDGTGKSDISTGLNFFDHMLDQIARHGLIDLELTCNGDLDVDEHHTIEDTAIALGQAIREAISENKAGIQRYGFVLPMDEAQATVAIDLSDRPFLRWDVDLKREYVGDFPTEMLEHFYYTLAMNVKATLHVEATGKNEHHIIESIFKGFAKALRFAISRNERIRGILPTTKGTI